MSEKLTPCPFCGGKAKIYRNAYSMYYVECQNEECEATIFGGTTPTEAVRAWNRRANNAKS